MLTPVATLAFLFTLWLVGVVVVQMLSESGSKLSAALKGQSVLATEPGVRPVAVRVSQRARSQPALRARPQLRAAA